MAILVGITVALATQWQNIRFSYTEANLLPDDHPVNQVYNDFLEKFGEEGNLIVLAVKDSSLFTPEKFIAWNKLSEDLSKYPEVENVISLNNLKTLQKFEEPQRFEMVPFIQEENLDEAEVEGYREQLFSEMPFYENLIYSANSSTIQTVVYLDERIVNSEARKDFVFDKLQPLIEEFEEVSDLEVYVSGMPYIRTLNAQSIIDEIGLFIGAALFVTSLIFFFFFRSVRATVISMVTVLIGVMWSFGIIGLFNYELTVLTALIPPLIIVIGVPNCIFLINKYQQEIKNHGNQARSLQRVITKVGNATLLTNVTTASGFATFIFTDSTLLKEFGTVASINIIAIFLLSLLIIPIIYSYMRLPKDKHLKHLNKRWIGAFVDWMEQMVRHRRITIYITSIILLAASIIGIYQIRISGSLLEDMPQDEGFFDDIRFFEEEFDGIMPLEIVVDTKRPRGALSLSNLKRLESLETAVSDVPELSSPLSVVRLAKYSKQAYYNNNPKYYQLPTSQEQNFISPYLKGISSDDDLLSAYVDSTGQFARMTTFMKDIGTEEMERIELSLWPQINKIFPEDRFDVTMTGKALIFQKGTSYLVKNLLISLSLAIF